MNTTVYICVYIFHSMTDAGTDVTVCDLSTCLCCHVNLLNGLYVIVYHFHISSCRVSQTSVLPRLADLHHGTTHDVGQAPWYLWCEVSADQQAQPRLLGEFIHNHQGERHSTG